MLHAKHPTSVNEHKLRCKECTAQDHSQDTLAMKRLCPGPKPYDICSECEVVLVHPKEEPGCNVSKAQWNGKRHGDCLCLGCASKKRARCCLRPGPRPYDTRRGYASPWSTMGVHPCQASAYHPEFNPWGTTVFLECATHCASKAEADAGGKGQEAVVGAGKVAGGVGSDSEMLQPVLHNSCEMPALHNEVI